MRRAVGVLASRGCADEQTDIPRGEATPRARAASVVRANPMSNNVSVSNQEVPMRTMIRVTIPVEAGNASLKNGRLPQVMREVLDRLKPEAAYFTLASGARTAYLVVDLKSQSDIPSMVE